MLSKLRERDEDREVANVGVQDFNSFIVLFHPGTSSFFRARDAGDMSMPGPQDRKSVV